MNICLSKSLFVLLVGIDATLKQATSPTFQEYAETSLDVAHHEKYQQYKHNLHEVTTQPRWPTPCGNPVKYTYLCSLSVRQIMHYCKHIGEVTQEQAMKAQMGSRSIALLFL